MPPAAAIALVALACLLPAADALYRPLDADKIAKYTKKYGRKYPDERLTAGSDHNKKCCRWAASGYCVKGKGAAFTCPMCQWSCGTAGCTWSTAEGVANFAWQAEVPQKCLELAMREARLADELRDTRRRLRRKQKAEYTKRLKPVKPVKE